MTNFFLYTVVLYEDEILPAMQEEFPFLQLSSHTAKLMWQKQMRQVHTLCKAARLNRPSKVQKQIEEAQRKQEMLSRIIQKELDHNNRLVCKIFLLFWVYKKALEVTK